jgi:hypothetical protein
MVTFYLTMVAIYAVWRILDLTLFKPAWQLLRSGAAWSPLLSLCYVAHLWSFIFTVLWATVFVVASYAYAILLVLKLCQVLPEVVLKYL